MRFDRLLVLAVLAASFQVAGAAAQQTEIPAEFPPSSYQGRQYVDSRGCIFVRAGIDGAVNWVPRVTRQREHLCGARPTFADAPAPEPATQRTQRATVIASPSPPEPAPVRGPENAAAPAPVRAAAAPPGPAPAPTVAPVRRTQASAPPMATVAPRSIPAARQAQVPPAVSISPKSAPAAATGQTYSTARAACQSGAAYVARRSGDGTLVRIRCAPQAQPPLATLRRAKAPETGKTVYANRTRDARSLPGKTRIVPRHVYEGRDEQVVTVPEGYRTAFEDDRLNRKRANQSIDGYRATQLDWTNTVPRRLVDRRSGRDVTAKYPKLVYPYTDYTTQRAALSTRSSAPQAVQTTRREAVSSQGRFVQIGTFGVRANAENTATRLQRMGLPVTFSTLRRGGKSYRVVLAGPFDTGAQISAALGSARRAGFGDAFIR